MAKQTIQAAGGIVLRGGTRPLFAVVQRSKDEKWVLPRGKLKRDENPITGARREVVEETGHGVEVNEFLGAITYRAGGRAKVVLFWQMQAEDAPSHELMADIVAVEWLPLKAATRRLSYPLEKLFLRNVGRRAAKHREGRKLPRQSTDKKANKKADKKAGKKARKKSDKKPAKKSAKTLAKTSGKRVAKKSKASQKAKAKRGRKSAAKNIGKNTSKSAGKNKPAKPAATRTRKTPARAIKTSVLRNRESDRAPLSLSLVQKPVAPTPAKPAALTVTAAERRTILQRMLGRLGS